MIKLVEGETIAVWNFVLPSNFEGPENTKGGDFLYGLSYENREGKRIIVGTYRFRYYTKNPTGDPFKDQDIKHWYEIVFDLEKTTESYILASIRQIIKKLSCGNQVYEFLFKDQNFKEVMKKFMDAPMMYGKQMSKEEYEKKYDLKI